MEIVHIYICFSLAFRQYIYLWWMKYRDENDESNCIEASISLFIRRQSIMVNSGMVKFITDILQARISAQRHTHTHTNEIMSRDTRMNILLLSNCLNV